MINHNDSASCGCEFCGDAVERSLFLIGGHDLEMQTIIELLKENDQNFVDRNLRWDNAVLSVYKDLLGFEGAIFGVELYEDITPRKNYYRIDHHNDFIGKKSSLEQVADILGVKMTRCQKLVAANDSRYIPGMVDLGATETEIREIRKADRKAQGVTDADEILADKAIENNLSMRNGVMVVKLETNRFSAICDKLYPYKKLLIYSDSELVYYGEDVGKVACRFEDEIKCGRAFKGGGETGFFGLASGHFSKNEILYYLDKIINLL